MWHCGADAAGAVDCVLRPVLRIFLGRPRKAAAGVSVHRQNVCLKGVGGNEGKRPGQNGKK